MILLLQVFWLLAPAMSTNCIATLYGGKIPMDFGLKFTDGRRIFGDGKTWKGYIFGILLGALIGIPWYALGYFAFDMPVPPNPVFFLLLSCWGAMTGDAFGSFIKRRIGIERGQKAPFLDQLTFYYFMCLIIYSTDYRIYFPVYETLIYLPVIVFVLHRMVNSIGYRLGLKSVPW